MDRGRFLSWCGRVAAVSGAVLLGTFTAMVATPPQAGSAPVTVQDVVPTSTSLRIDSTAPTAGQAIPVTATVSSDGGVPAGTVAFSVDGAPQASGPVDGGGTASAVVSAATAGPHTIRAVFSGEGDFATSSAAQRVVVGAAPPVELAPPLVITNDPPQIGDAASVSNPPSAPPRSSPSSPAASSPLPNTGPGSGSQLPNTGAPSLIVVLLGGVGVMSGVVALCVARMNRLWRSSLG